MNNELQLFDSQKIHTYLEKYRNSVNKFDSNFYIENNVIVFKGILMQDSLSLSNNNFYSDKLKFIGCELLDISQGMFNSLEFQNSKVEKIIILKGELNEFKDLLIDTKSEISIITIDNISVKNITIVDSEVNILDINNSKAIQKIEISGSKINSINIISTSILNFDIIGQSKIDSLNLRNEVEINILYLNAVINSYINFEGSLVKKLNIDQLSKIRDFYIRDGSKIQNLISHTGSFIGIIEINGQVENVELNSKIAILKLHNLPCPNIFSIHSSEIEELYISKNSNGYLNLYIKDSEIAKLEVSNTVLRQDDLINISTTSIYLFTLNKILNNGRFILSEIIKLDKWKSYSFENFSKNEKEFIFLDQDSTTNKFNTKNSTFSIYDSDMGNISFINFNFNNFNRVNMRNSKIQGGFLSGLQLPTNVINLDHENDFDQIRLFYSQIKSIFQNQGDTPRAIYAQALELESFRLQLENQKKSKLSNVDSWNNFKDRFVLFLNKYTSNYNTNWLRALMVTICFLAFSFGLYCFILGYRPGYDGKKFLELCSYSLQYLNPFRDEDSGDFFKLIGTDGFKINSCARFWDYISRLIIAFLVYQTINSFRRLGKN